MKTAVLRSLVLLVATLTISGCITTGDDDPTGDLADDEAPEPEVILPIITKTSGLVDKSIATPVISFNSGGTFSHGIKPTANVTGYVIELTWTSTGPTNDQLDLWVRDASAGAIPPSSADDVVPIEPIARTTGESPLRLTLTADQFEEIQYSILVRAAGPVGVANEQAYDLRIATFADVAFEPDFDFDAEPPTAPGNETRQV